MSTAPEQRAGVADVDLSKAVVLVTGATDGVGRETALAYGRLGATVVAHGRSAEKAQSLERTLSKTDASHVDVRRADFTDLESVRDLAAHVSSNYDRLDVLHNNAAAYFDTGALTDEGVERTIAVNHLGPFGLTNRLVDLVEDTGGRVVTTSSAIHRRATVDFDAFESTAEYDGMDAYARSKFANVVYTYALADRLDEATATCFHPGFIPGSGLYRNGSVPVRAFMAALDTLPRSLTSWLVSSTVDGAAAAVYLGVSEAVAGETGAYFDQMDRAESATDTYDDELQGRLWEWSERFYRD